MTHLLIANQIHQQTYVPHADLLELIEQTLGDTDPNVYQDALHRFIDQITSSPGWCFCETI